MRLAVYTDYSYRRDADGVSGERAFVRFMVALTPHVEKLTLVGRLDPRPGRSHYPLPASVGFVGLPFYASLTRPARVVGSLGRATRRFWRLLDDVDTVWLLGPYLHAVLFALLALLRGRRVVLGVRQDFPVLVRSRYPSTRWIHLAADALEAIFALMSRRLPIVVVGPQLARNYARAPRLLALNVSLISHADLVNAAQAATRPVAEPARVLSVGRVDTEKNPLLLAEILRGLRDCGVAAHLDVVGEGPLQARLAERLAERDVTEQATLHGYVPIDGGLLDIYRRADVFLHVSWTEGLPQVLYEAFAAGLPVVATDVGGVGEAVADAAMLVPPGAADAAVAAVQRVVTDPELRARLIRAGSERVSTRTIERETQRLADFLRAA